MHTVFPTFIIFHSNAGSRHLLCILLLDKNPIERIGSGNSNKESWMHWGEGGVRMVPSRPVGRFPHHRILHFLPAIFSSPWNPPASAIVSHIRVCFLHYADFYAGYFAIVFKSFCQRQNTKYKIFNGIR